MPESAQPDAVKIFTELYAIRFGFEEWEAALHKLSTDSPEHLEIGKAAVFLIGIAPKSSLTPTVTDMTAFLDEYGGADMARVQQLSALSEIQQLLGLPYAPKLQKRSAPKR